MTPSTIVTLARHGQTPWHDGNRYTGSTDIEIDETGQRQARELAVWAQELGPDALYASTMKRAQQTAMPVADTLGLDLRTDERLRELDFGTAEGRSLAEVRVSDPKAAELFVSDPVSHHMPGGEHPERAADRGVEALGEIVERHRGQSVLVVCHSTLIRLVIARYAGIPLGRYRVVLRGMEPTATSRLTFRADGTVMIDYYNRVSSADGRNGVPSVRDT
jgi:probable phosphoglycerate mutase